MRPEVAHDEGLVYIWAGAADGQPLTPADARQLAAEIEEAADEAALWYPDPDAYDPADHNQETR